MLKYSVFSNTKCPSFQLYRPCMRWNWINSVIVNLAGAGYSIRGHPWVQLALEKMMTSLTTRDGWICTCTCTCTCMALWSIREHELSWVWSSFCLNPPSSLKWQILSPPKVVIVTGTSFLKTHSSSDYIFVDLRYAIMYSLIDFAFMKIYSIHE